MHTAAPADAGPAAAKPVSLDAWQAAQEQGQTAAQTGDLEERISRCRAFLERHPEHPQAIKVIEALTDALVAIGDFDGEELSRLIERRVKLADESYTLPVDLVRTNYLEHNLPLASGLELLHLGRRRIELAREELAYRAPDMQMEFRNLTLQGQQTDTYLMEARLYLHHRQPREALDVLDRLDAELEELAGAGLTPAHGRPRFSTGDADAFLVLRAAALRQLGQHSEAREALAISLGFLDDPGLLTMYETLGAEYGLRSADELTVKAEPRRAQDFALEDLNGDIVSLSDYRGEVVLVTFWATWCAYCPGEMRELQAFRREHADQGVTVLAVSIDQFGDRPKIRPFLDRFDLDLPVLLAEPEQLTEYNYRGVPALYVIDREGQVAHARVGNDPALKDKLAQEFREIVTGDSESGRTLLTMEIAPEGFAMRWQRPFSDEIHALAIAPPAADQPGKIAAAGTKGLTRWSAAGTNLGTRPGADWTLELLAVDLDGDGSREWIGGGWGALRVFDDDGALYWERPIEGQAQLVGIRDLNGDGFQEIIMQDGIRIEALQAVPEPLWESSPFRSLQAAIMGSSGDLVVQADGVLHTLNARGERSATGRAAPEGRLLAARILTPGGELNLFTDMQERFSGSPTRRLPVVDHDVDGDGRNDIVVIEENGVVAYSIGGETLLRVRGHDVRISAAAVGNLDGQPGVEIALAIRQYGLVVLGGSTSTAVAEGSTV